MKTSEYDTKVKLKVDLTKYHPSLKVGIKGVTAGRQGIWSRNQDRFITVKFPKHTLDVLWDGLEIVDKEYLNELEEYKKKENEKLKTANDVELIVSKYGTLKYISYKVIDYGIKRHTSENLWDDIIKLIKIFNKYNIPIRVTILDNNKLTMGKIEQVKNKVKMEYGIK